MSFDHATWGKHAFNKGDMVQMTRLGLKRQRKDAMHPKTEDSRGTFLRWQGWSGVAMPKHRYALVRWYINGYRGVEQLTRVDYLEPHGTPR